ncbi:MAG: hypothetical protein HYS09_02185 [Chloroflexi bacterium]|nr:hypothetical protein [Chloroflexota bacterium]
MQCARHPKVETELACGRCETPICPRCVVMTDVGARCPQCAPRRPPLLQEVGPRYFLQAAAAAMAGGAALGALWGLMLPPGSSGLSFVSIILAVIVGYLIGQIVSRAANRRTGPPLQAVAIAGVVVAYLARNLAGEQALIVTNDLAGWIAAALAALVAYVSVD